MASVPQWGIQSFAEDGFAILHIFTPAGGKKKNMRSHNKKSELQPSHRELMRRVRAKKTATSRKPAVKVPAVVSVRNASGLSQAQFAVLLGVSVRTLQKWEQGARAPSGAAQSLIRIAQRHPEILADAIQ
jgi:putative transcriptional regulator